MATIVEQSALERAARAIDPAWFGEHEGKHVLDNYPGQHLEYQELAREKARAVLLAIREPSTGMIDEGDYKCGHGDNYSVAVWQAMIDAALA